MWNFRSFYDQGSTAGPSWGAVVMLLRALAIAAFLLIVIGLYTKHPRDTPAAVATTLDSNVKAHGVSDVLAACEQRYAEWARSHPNEGPGALRAEMASEDCIESEP
jgi:hypothetical protein